MMDNELMIWDGESRAIDRVPESLERWRGLFPPWRTPASKDISRRKTETPDSHEQDVSRGSTWRGEGEDLVERVNMALWLRRPILVEGEPGIGKSSLAYSLAWSLGLGRVLRWEISSRTTLQDGLYHYDAVSHLRQSQMTQESDSHSVADFITLGALGTALVGSDSSKPRVLLIDEIDKSDYDLPNDLLHVLEEASFGIPELKRSSVDSDEPLEVQGFDEEAKEGRIGLKGGRVVSGVHPIVVMTSNAEREFPDAFRRRCVPLRLERPRGRKLEKLVQLHFDKSEVELKKKVRSMLRYPDSSLEGRPDQVLQGLFMRTQGMSEEQVRKILREDSGD